MTASPQPDGPTTSEILVEVYDPADYAAAASAGLAGRLRPRPMASPLDSKVLVVADDLLLRIVIVEALAFAGIGVVEAADCAEANEILGERNDIGVLLTDVSVPGRVDDLGLAWKCCVEHPDLPVVMMSALLGPDSMEIPPGVLFIQKPFTPDLLVQVVKPLLASHPATAPADKLPS